MNRLVTIVGARPQFVKVAPVSRELALSGVEEILIHTGQHFDANMSDIFFQELGIRQPDIHLDVHGGNHGAMTGLMMQKLEPVLEFLRPDRVLVYGDTNSTLAGALVAAKLGIAVAHVEAGLRSFNRAMPEEINRVMTDHLSDLLFTPTRTATGNLQREGFAASRIFQVGDVMYDAGLLAVERTARSTVLQTTGVQSGNYILATLHRAENTANTTWLSAIVSALEEVADTMPVVLPLHPRTAACMRKTGLKFQRVMAVEPLGYLDMAALVANAALIATDSGGVQKEAFFHRVPCVTYRTETEWVELVDLGWNRLAPPDQPGLCQAMLAAIGTRGVDAAPYGDGHAAREICRIICQ
ncbi:non-hydrolyzing UDP-N-acetylglucosamine 2-epimerase [Aureimonas fodinaquatilis]|uniref:non-hydrolyzing UDP-N-acetylglucosamine 2-epimerase n=1 Tax=Aureimonas fodinaquatilis TaxID=2565783 RepID=UPI001FE69373|nr:UDP-N-acetylglucosamine 2-epimerase (non-hydrolyzing) [Aureimonas fodinaquatilis]